MERVGDRQGKMEGYCLTDRSTQWVIVPMEEEEKYTKAFFLVLLQLQNASNVTHYSTVVSDKNSEKFHSIKEGKVNPITCQEGTQEWGTVIALPFL